MKDQANIDEIISKSVKEAIREFDKEKKAEGKKKIIHNTKLLLKNYNDLKNYYKNAIDDVKKLGKQIEELEDLVHLDRDELYILSIKKSKSKTLIMIAHIDMALEQLKKKQRKLGTSEKYKALEMLYIDEIPYEKIIEHFNCGVNTPRRWISDMVNELSILLFGVDGVKLGLV